MSRCVVNVATGRYVKGQARLLGTLGEPFLAWTDPAQIGAPSHQERPYAFKAYALQAAVRQGYTQLLWADACIVPNYCPLDRIWEHAKKHGVWLSKNGYWNYEWTAAEAYGPLGVTPEENKRIQHVVATAFAVDLEHPKGREFLAEYYRLASETDAFCGPWTGGIGVQHRHDQTAASVIAHRLEIPLTDPPDFFAYLGGETSKTVLIADGCY
jgi:hypothetical protein